MPLLKVTTSGNTFYLIDEERKRFKRHKGDDSASGPMWFDGEWNEYHDGVTIRVGQRMLFLLVGHEGALQKSSAVTSIETIKSEPAE